MTATAPPPPLPRIITKPPSPRGETISLVSREIQQYSKANRQVRYANLPDVPPNYDPKTTDTEIEEMLTERFEALGAATDYAIEQRIRALIISGPGGVGKSFLVDKALEEWDPDGTKHTTHSGYSTPVGLLKMLYYNRHENNLLKLDDIDSIFNDDKSLNLIKRACDTSRERIITYASQAVIIDEDTGDQIPTRFEFNATLLFNTNLDFDQLIDAGSKLSPHLEALMTRAHYVDLKMRTKRHYLIRLFMVANEGKLFENIQGGALTEKEQNDVLDFVEENYKILRECSLRMALKIAGLRKGAKETDKISWQRMAQLTCCRGVR